MTSSPSHDRIQTVHKASSAKGNEMKPKMYRPLSTILVLLKKGPIKELVEDEARRQKIDIWRVRSATDLIAVGAIVAIVDPTRIGRTAWSNLREWLEEMDDPHTKILLVGPSPHPQKLPAKNLVRTPREINRQFVKLLLVHQRSTFERRKRVFEKKERQILRLMFMLARLDLNPPLRLRDVAEEFAVTRRTAQRDLEVLLMAGYPIVEEDKQGRYVFASRFKSYQNYFGGDADGRSI